MPPEPVLEGRGADPLLQLAGISQVFTPPSGKTVTVLRDVDLALRAGELVAILGPSGCGKSTLLRIAAGLLRPTQGAVRYRGEPVIGPNPAISLVFQQFALFPWLTVGQNIEQALIARGIEREERRRHVAEVVGLIGLEGFEEAYPRELSGGMKQRVGIARALVVKPEILCMDEPFSQVDALTAETLRTEVVHLWQDRDKYPRAILLVSHDIQEVASMASRILIMAAVPGRIKTVLDNPLPYPRDLRALACQALIDRLHQLITGVYLPEPEPAEQQAAGQPPEPLPALPLAAGPSGPRPIAAVPLVEVREVVGLLQVIWQRGADIEFFLLTAELGLAFTRALLAAKAAELLGFLDTPQDRLVLTELGRRLIEAPRKIRRQLFAAQLARLPLVTRVQDMLTHSPDHRLPKDVLLEDLAIQCPQEDPRRLLRILLNWGQFARLWTYDPATGSLILNGAADHPAVSTG